MHKLILVLLVVGMTSGAALGARPGGFLRCCLVLPIPEVPPVPTCVQLHVRGQRVGARRACRLLGGRPIGRGDCGLALCRGPHG